MRPWLVYERAMLQANQERLSKLGMLIVVMSVCFNAVLAFINANITALGAAHVAMCELALLSLAVYVVVKNGPVNDVFQKSVLFFLLMIVLSLLVLLVNGSFYPKILRDVMIVAVFSSLGSVCKEKHVVRCVLWLAAVLILFMLLEWLATDIYVLLFQPSKYYEATRGIEEFALDDSGLFQNSLGFEGRFSFGISDHRMSSLLLEQVSLANLAMVTTIFATAFWARLNLSAKRLVVVFVVFVVLSNSTRTGILFVLLSAASFRLFPKFLAGFSIVVLPVFLGACALLFFDPNYGLHLRGDDLVGRVAYTLARLDALSPLEWIAGAPELTAAAQDCGYVYLVSSLGVLGLLAWWIFPVWLIGPQGPEGRRLAFGLAIFLSLNLMIGAGVFTIKIAGLLWFIVGHIAARRERIA